LNNPPNSSSTQWLHGFLDRGRPNHFSNRDFVIPGTTERKTDTKTATPSVLILKCEGISGVFGSSGTVCTILGHRFWSCSSYEFFGWSSRQSLRIVANRNEEELICSLSPQVGLVLGFALHRSPMFMILIPAPCKRRTKQQRHQDDH